MFLLEYVAVDITLEELLMRRFETSNVNTHFVSINSIKATAFHFPGKFSIIIIIFYKYEIYLTS